MKRKLIFDSECYVNYYLAAFLDIETGETFYYEKHNDSDFVKHSECLLDTLKSNTIITFNGINYDMPLALLAVKNVSNKMLKQASDAIIKGGMSPWDVERNYGTLSIKEIKQHIDLFNVAPGKGSLKIYGGRMHSKKMQDLPIQPDARISQDDAKKLRPYCVNDLQTTYDLYKTLLPQLELRVALSKKEGLDLRSKSDPQIAEWVIRKRIYGNNKPPKQNVSAGSTFKFDVPAVVSSGLKSKGFREFMEAARDGKFTLSNECKIIPPAGIEGREIEYASMKYRTGIGGLHSCEDSVSYRADDETGIFDRDVASYYPSIILNNELYPQHIGKAFLGIYREFYRERLAAKKNGDKTVADCFKILLNGTFGKLGNRWSCIFSPKLLIQTTIGGQLYLMLLIEAVTNAGGTILSANTDGITFSCKRSLKAEIDSALAAWERHTGFVTEETEYASIHLVNVNNYVAIKTDGKIKTKGSFAEGGLMKNPVSPVCVDAVAAWLNAGIPLSDTIRACRDIRKFVVVRGVTGGAHCEGVYLGKAVRWYYSSISNADIRYISNGNLVPKSEGCEPCMELPDELPIDIDYPRYVNEARKLLISTGAIR